jgi:hypothetical protein
MENARLARPIANRATPNFLKMETPALAPHFFA